MDVNHDGVFESPEGYAAPPPFALQLGQNGAKQAAIDFMQLVRVLEAGIDVDGNGTVDLDPRRINARWRSH